MGKKQKNSYEQVYDPPENLDNCPFFGYTLNPEQKIFRDAIWSKDKDIVFCNAPAGSGKTFVAVATAYLLVQYKRYNGIVYIASPVQEGRQGYLPGDITEKSAVYFTPFYDAATKVGLNINTDLNDNAINSKYGTGFVELITHTFLRGCNIENKVVILDEAENYTREELLKTITRIHDNCKVIVIGHTKQIDLDRPEDSGFARYLAWFQLCERAAVCELKENYRGWISSHADAMPADYSIEQQCS